eukprot:2818458-Pyramimonas_sp.AAC.1
MPSALLPQEAAVLARLRRAVHCSIHRGGWLDLWRWKGPDCASSLVPTSAALARSSLRALLSRREILLLLRAATDDAIPARR